MSALVAVGGTIGTSARASLEATFPPAPGELPWVTLAINLTGSFALGAILELLLRTGPDTGWRRAVRLGCGTGVIGGFTTYSTFVLEIDQLARQGHLTVSVVYARLSVLAGLAAAGGGVLAASGFLRRRRTAAATPPSGGEEAGR
jgi:CrcB protein